MRREHAGEVGGGVDGQVGLVDRQDGHGAGGGDAGPVVLEDQALADVGGGGGGVAVAVGDGGGERHQVGGGERGGVVVGRRGVAGDRLHHCTDLVEGDVAGGVDAGGEHQIVAGGGAA